MSGDFEVVRREVDAWTIPPPDDARVIGCVLLTYGDLKGLAALSRLEAQQPTGEQPTPPECPARKACWDEAFELRSIMSGRGPADRGYVITYADAEAISRVITRLMDAALSTPCSPCPTCAELREIVQSDAIRRGIARQESARVLAERDALTRKVEKLVVVLRNLKNQIPEVAIEQARERWGNTNTRCALEARKSAEELLVEHEKEQG